jgi:trehalose synthase
MLDRTGAGRATLESYLPLLEEGLIEEIQELARDLRGVRVTHVNATANGGDVAEILRSLVPLYRGLGIDCSWLVMRGDDPFFQVTKKLHNALQGAGAGLSDDDWDTYMACNRLNASCLSADYDVVFLHDPQPAAVLQFVDRGSTRWIWRCHIDTSTPNPGAWERIAGLVGGFDAAVFSLPDFVGPGLQGLPTAIIPPAIDPITPKNRPMLKEDAARVVARHGLDPSRPFICQVSRFDPWKDPLGVLACFRALKSDHPDLQLAMLGNYADDDPEGPLMHAQVMEAASDLEDVHIITDLTDMVSPFQMLSKVILQKSLREGFGLTVTEALWKGTPVVGGDVGGIRLQVGNGVGGFLVSTIDECATKVDYLLTHEDERVAMGASGRLHVRRNFLLPRLLRDELLLIRGVLSGAGAPSPAPSYATVTCPPKTSPGVMLDLD